MGQLDSTCSAPTRSKPLGDGGDGDGGGGMGAAARERLLSAGGGAGIGGGGYYSARPASGRSGRWV
jgi:hypothetical protein